MLSKILKSVLTFVTLLFSAVGGAAQNYTQIQWGMNKGVTPYAFGANINGTWRDLGTISSAGAWTLSSAISQDESAMTLTWPWAGVNTYLAILQEIDATKANDPEIGAAFIMRSNTGSSDSVRNFKMPLGVIAVAEGPASAAIWGENIVTQLQPGTNSNAGMIGLEIDLVNNARNFTGTLQWPYSAGVYVTAHSATYINNAAYASDGIAVTWDYGFVSNSSYAGTTINTASFADLAKAPIAFYSAGNNNYGLKLDGTYAINTISAPNFTLSQNGNLLTNGDITSGAGNLSISGTSSVGGLGTFNSGIAVGVAGALNGSVQFRNATSGSITLQPPAGALGTVTATLPANTGTIAETNLAQTFSATQTFSAGIISAGTAPTATGSGGTCAAGAVTGGALVGTVALTGVCASTNTLALTSMPAATTGYVCDAADRTTGVVNLVQTATTTTGATFTFSASTGATDVIQFKCMGY